MRTEKAAGGRSHLQASFASLRNRDFRFLLFSGLSLGFGQWFQQVGLGLLAYHVTGSGTQLGAITAVRNLVSLVASPVGGILSDRFPRRSVVVVSTGFGLAQATLLAVLIALHRIELWHLYAFSVVEGFVAGVNQPARQAMVRDVTDEGLLPNAVALSSAAQSASRVAGPPLAGAMYGFLGPASVFFTLAGLKGLAMAATLLISRKTRQEFNQHQESVMESLKSGAKYSVQDSTILALLMVATIPSLLIYPYVQMLPFFAYDVLGSDAQGYGWLASALGWGSIVGLLVLTLLGDVRRKGLTSLVSLSMYTLLVCAFSQSKEFALSMGLLIVAGVFHAPAMALNNTLLLLRAPPEMTGRVMAFIGMIQGIGPVGAVAMGVAVDWWGAPVAVGAFALAGALAIAAVALTSRSLREA